MVIACCSVNVSSPASRVYSLDATHKESIECDAAVAYADIGWVLAWCRTRFQTSESWRGVAMPYYWRDDKA